MEDYKVVTGLWISSLTESGKFLSFKVEKIEDYQALLLGNIVLVFHLIVRSPGMANMYIPGYLGAEEPMPLNPHTLISIALCNEATSKSLDDGIQQMFDKKKEQASGLVLPPSDLVQIQK